MGNSKLTPKKYSSSWVKSASQEFCSSRRSSSTSMHFNGRSDTCKRKSTTISSPTTASPWYRKTSLGRIVSGHFIRMFAMRFVAEILTSTTSRSFSRLRVKSLKSRPGPLKREKEPKNSNKFLLSAVRKEHLRAKVTRITKRQQR